jgi:hypothetical protein
MNVVDGGSLLATLLLWVAGALAAVVAINYFLRPRTRAAFKGGQGRYLTAVIVQAAGFILPIPVVLLILLGRPIPQGLDVVAAVLAGLAVVFALRMLPWTGPLLKDLHRARVEAAMQRLEGRT